MKPIKTLDKIMLSVFTFGMLVALTSMFIFFCKIIRVEGMGLTSYERVQTANSIPGFRYYYAPSYSLVTEYFSVFDRMYSNTYYLPILTMVFAFIALAGGVAIFILGSKTNISDKILKGMKIATLGLCGVVLVLGITSFVVAFADKGPLMTYEPREDTYYFVKEYASNPNGHFIVQ